MKIILTLIYIDKVKTNLYIGISTITVITGKSVVHECMSSNTDQNSSLDDTISFMKQYSPREVVVVGYMSDDIITYLELESKKYFVSQKRNE